MLNILFTVLMLVMPACDYEDSTNCYWDGGSNSQGQQFIDINGQTIYKEG